MYRSWHPGPGGYPRDHPGRPGGAARFGYGPGGAGPGGAALGQNSLVFIIHCTVVFERTTPHDSCHLHKRVCAQIVIVGEFGKPVLFYTLI